MVYFASTLSNNCATSTNNLRFVSYLIYLFQSVASLRSITLPFLPTLFGPGHS